MFRSTCQKKCRTHYKSDHFFPVDSGIPHLHNGDSRVGPASVLCRAMAKGLCACSSRTHVHKTAPSLAVSFSLYCAVRRIGPLRSHGESSLCSLESHSSAQSNAIARRVFFPVLRRASPRAELLRAPVALTGGVAPGQGQVRRRPAATVSLPLDDGASLGCSCVFGLPFLIAALAFHLLPRKQVHGQCSAKLSLCVRTVLCCEQGFVTLPTSSRC